MSPQQPSKPVRDRRPSFFQLTFLALLLVACGVGFMSSTAQSSQGNATSSSNDERKSESTIPEHAPIKLKLKNEQAFKNVKNKSWARELELEVKNTGSKPIYFLYVVIFMPEVMVAGNPSGFQVTYGRKDLVRLDAPIQPDDIPIQPGETITLKLPESQVKAYEGLRDEEKRDDPKRVQFDMQVINFGDGTGLRGIEGKPYPNPNRKKGLGASCQEPPTRGNLPAATARTVNSSYKISDQSPFMLPARGLRVNFSLPTNFSTSASMPVLQDQDVCVVDTYVERRYYSADGNWRGFIQFNNGFRVEQVAEAGRGVFIVDSKTKERRFHSPFPERPHDKPKESKHYARTETVLGYSADVLRYEQGDQTHELYRAPDLNGDIIKTVYRDKTLTRTLEPVSITLGEPPPN